MHSTLDDTVRWEDLLYIFVAVRFEALVAGRSIGTLSIATPLFDLKEKYR